MSELVTGLGLQMGLVPLNDGTDRCSARWYRVRVEVELPALRIPDDAYRTVADRWQLIHEFPNGWLRVVAVLSGRVPDLAMTDPDPDRQCPYADIDSSVYREIAGGLPQSRQDTFTVFVDCGGQPMALTVNAANWMLAEAAVLDQLAREGFGPYDATPALIAASVPGRVLPVGERRFTSPSGEPWTHSLQTCDLAG